MAISIREYRETDIPEMANLWNEIVTEGVAFPQTDTLSPEEAAVFFRSQSRTGVAADGHGKILGLYILHPNNLGRCSHIANASYAVSSAARGMGIGEMLVKDSLSAARALSFRILQFNAVVRTNAPARHLYEKLGFVPLGIIPGGFRMDDHYEDIVLYYHTLETDRR